MVFIGFGSHQRCETNGTKTGQGVAGRQWLVSCVGLLPLVPGYSSWEYEKEILSQLLQFDRTAEESQPPLDDLKISFESDLLSFSALCALNLISHGVSASRPDLRRRHSLPSIAYSTGVKQGQPIKDFDSFKSVGRCAYYDDLASKILLSAIK